jgi:acyl-CoA thioester hydrolase
MQEYMFELVMKVRDYECDLQGVVNNSNYQRYMEHTRHEYLESLGENFGRMHERGVDAFISRVDIRFRHSLRSGDSFRSCLKLWKEGVRLVFEQDIYRLADGVLAAQGRIESVVVEQGRLTRGEYFDRLLAGITDKKTDA